MVTLMVLALALTAQDASQRHVRATESQTLAFIDRGLCATCGRQRERPQHLTIRVTRLAKVDCALAQATAADNDNPAIARIRSTDPVLAALIGRGAAQSSTFQQLRTAIQRSNGMVQVEKGNCRHGVRACLLMWMEIAGSNRFLRIVIDRRKGDSDVDVMASIGHELQHAVEALSESGITDGRSLYNFFGRLAPTIGDPFETTAAIDVGDAIRRELRRC
jgi:hypothetical protein